MSFQSDTAIRVENLSKRYRIGVKEKKHETLTSALLDFTRRPLRNLRDLRRLSRFDGPPDGQANDILWALKDVSFEVKTGEVVGIIGRNGAGKSTLLKILSRITRPTSGRVVLNGRVASLLEVGTGFHPDLSGRENVYLNGTILGMTKAEIDRKFDEIVDFSGVERLIDTPVKRYSSGMYVRLAFAVAAHLEAEILLVDEVLAVGDAEFQKKCLGKMGDIAHDGRTVLFVSHNMAAVRNLCRYTIWLRNGQASTKERTETVIEQYLSTGQCDQSIYEPGQETSYPQNGPARLLRVAATKRDGKVTDTFSSDSEILLTIDYELRAKIEDARVGYRLVAADGTVVLTSCDTDPAGNGTPRAAGKHRSTCTIPPNFLNAGRYYLTVALDRPMREVLFLHENVISFHIDLVGGIGGATPDGRLGVVRPLLTWNTATPPPPPDIPVESVL